jgi:hypothetical protein
MGIPAARSFAHEFDSFECLAFSYEVQEHRVPTLNWDKGTSDMFFSSVS